MLNIFKHFVKAQVKSNLTTPYFAYRIVFRKGYIRGVIMRAKGWKTYAELARNWGLTRAYICMLDKQQVGVTATVITRCAASLGNVNGNWYEPYVLVPLGDGEFDQNHPVWNQEKHMGRLPYAQYSDSAEIRRKDYAVETKKSDSKKSSKSS